MPATKPDSLDGPFGQQTFQDFLRAHGLTALVGSLQYGYEVQGYGPLKVYSRVLWAVVDNAPHHLDDTCGRAA